MTTFHPEAAPAAAGAEPRPRLVDAAAEASELTRQAAGGSVVLSSADRVGTIETTTQNVDRTITLRMADGRATELRLHPGVLGLGADEVAAQVCDVINDARAEHDAAVLAAASRIGGPDAVAAAERVHEQIRTAFSAEIDDVVASTQRGRAE